MKEYKNPKIIIRQLEDILATSAEEQLMSGRADVIGGTATFDINWETLMGDY